MSRAGSNETFDQCHHSDGDLLRGNTGPSGCDAHMVAYLVFIFYLATLALAVVIGGWYGLLTVVTVITTAVILNRRLRSSRPIWRDTDDGK